MSKHDARECQTHQRSSANISSQARTSHVTESVHDMLASEGQHLDDEMQALQIGGLI
jgi:hypothetical protein